MICMQVSYDALIQTEFGAIAFNTILTKTHQAIAIELLANSPEKNFVTQLPKTNFVLLNDYVKHIQAYLQNPLARWQLPKLTHGTPFQQRVWQAIFEIPVGQTKTYGQLARQLNSGPRAVANACGANTLPILIPCHRVVAKNGLGGFMQSQSAGTFIKTWLLKHEGCAAND